MTDRHVLSNVAIVGALIADPCRAAILTALMDGTSRPAGELAELAGATPQAASAHLAKLVDGGLLAVLPQGRHRYYRIAGPEIAHALETLLGAAELCGHHPARAVPEPFRQARRCYDHLAGKLGVALYRSFADRGFIAASGEGLALGEPGRRWLADFAPDAFAEAARSRSPLLKDCVDWTERRPHLAGRIGALLCRELERREFVARQEGSRTLRVTPAGQAFLAREFGVSA